MAKYRKIDPRIWNDAKFASLTHEGQRLFLYILTHPSMTSLGAFRATPEGLMSEIGINTLQSVEQCTGQCTQHCKNTFDALLVQGLVKYDDTCKTVFAPNFIKYNPPENSNVVIGWTSALDQIPEGPLKLEALERAKASVMIPKKRSKSDKNLLLKAFYKSLEDQLISLRNQYQKDNKTLSGTVSQTVCPIQEQEQEQEQYINNTNKQQTEICNEGSAEEEVVCSEDSDPIFDEPLSEQLNQLAIQQTNKVVDDPNAIIDPVQAIGIARTHGIKLPRTIDLENVCKRKILTVDNMRQCIRLAKRQGNSKGIYVIGIMKNAVNEPSQYHTEEYKTSQRVTLDDVDPNYVFGSEK